MRFASVLTLIPLALSLGLLANAQDHTLDSREYVDELSAREDYFGDALAAREILFSISTREIVNVLSERLERRGDKTCKRCGHPESWGKLCPAGNHSVTTSGKWWNNQKRLQCTSCDQYFAETVRKHSFNSHLLPLPLEALGAGETTLYEDADMIPAFKPATTCPKKNSAHVF
ncbi:hypothetical protein DFP72DRAFT_1068191 [Ephemerocybe angulata]|uniref:C2H2-type domain-containing protein n=1 Tax=Ephemerocybe angulata TaxID=980116 RepID=A0A8H6HWN8_9AGAR|nr:hypothetical protein DFP72DRAFT_1068191 [Tulosesus angulatus]